MSEKICNACGDNKQTISFAAYEANEARHERRETKFFIVILTLILLLVGTNAGWLWYERTMETVYETETETITTTYDVEQNNDTGTNNNFIGNGGEIVIGKSENTSD